MKTFFDEETRLEKLTKIGDSLETLNKNVDFEMFRDALNTAINHKKSANGGGRPPYDVVLMFKILVLQRLFNLSDDQTEYQINDRSSFRRFLNLDTQIPDAKTIWVFREALTKADMAEKLFSLFNKTLDQKGLVAKEGSIVDATFMDKPKQRNTREENESLKNGQVPQEWTNIHKIRQKDMDAKWAKKGDETHFGYKNHIKTDAKSKLVTAYAVTSANVHDSQALAKLIDKNDKILYADSAYVGVKGLPESLVQRVVQKAFRNKPLTEAQRALNKTFSKVRCRVEHVFAYMTNSMKGLTLRCVGLRRAEFNVGLTNLVYNFARYVFLMRGTT